MRRFHFVMLVALGSSTGCSGKVVDVGENGEDGEGGKNGEVEPIYATSPPPAWNESTPTPPPVWKLVDNEWEVTAVTADSGRVYWLSAGSLDSSTRRPPTLAIQSCDVTNCKSTFETMKVYEEDVSDGYGPITRDDSSIFLNTTDVFWRDPKLGGGAAYCSRSIGDGVKDLNPVIPGHVLLAFAVDDTHFYFATDESGSAVSATVGRCDIADCAATAVRFAMTAPAAEMPFSGITQIVLDGEYLYLVSGDRILRARKDGASNFEVIARQQVIGMIAVRGGSVFWTESVLLGRIQSCPISGCNGNPRLVASNLHAPQYLAVDDEYVYFTDPVDPYLGAGTKASSDRLLRCPIEDCSAPRVIAENEGIGSPVATDDQFVYFIGNAAQGPGKPLGHQARSYVGVSRK